MKTAVMPTVLQRNETRDNLFLSKLSKRHHHEVPGTVKEPTMKYRVLRGYNFENRTHHQAMGQVSPE